MSLPKIGAALYRVLMTRVLSEKRRVFLIRHNSRSGIFICIIPGSANRDGVFHFLMRMHDGAIVQMLHLFYSHCWLRRSGLRPGHDGHPGGLYDQSKLFASSALGDDHHESPVQNAQLIEDGCRRLPGLAQMPDVPGLAIESLQTSSKPKSSSTWSPMCLYHGCALTFEPWKSTDCYRNTAFQR